MDPMASFWNTLAVPWTRKRFEPVLRTLDIPTPPGTSLATKRDEGRLTAFLEAHFGSAAVRLRPTLDADRSIILFVEREGSIIATIRYKPGGHFEGQPIHLIDCFCIHPRHRRTGLATQLLGALHTHTNRLGLRYSLFLKEGAALPAAEPFYSSTYAYRRGLKGFKSPVTRALSPEQAARLVSVWRTLHPDTVWIHDVANPNQQWFFWKVGLAWALACVQDAFQVFEGGRIGWITAFFASGEYDIDAVVDGMPFDWIWMDAAWHGKGVSDEGRNSSAVSYEGRNSSAVSYQWKADGAFHWYAYQWTSCLRPQGFYGIVL